MTTRTPQLWIRCALALLLCNPARAQAPALALKPANAILNQEFTQISAVRELRDGRVIVADPREKRLIVATFGQPAVDTIGRIGRGPGEYLGVAPLYRIGQDSSILLDAAVLRWLLLDGSRVVTTIPPDHPAIIAAQGIPYGADSLGHLLIRQREPLRQGTLEYTDTDSLALFFVSRQTGRADTVAHMGAIPGSRRVWTDDQGKVIWAATLRPAFAFGDAALLTPDGWVAIARRVPYRVRWRTPEGKMIEGRPLPFTPVPVNDREKKFYLERNAATIATYAAAPKPTFLTEEQRAMSEAALKRPFTEFPATIPPFELSPLVATNDGRLLLRRIPSADHPETRYDVIDRRGVLVGQLTMPRNERAVSFGAHSIYVAVKDEDDVERLRRHPWP